MKSAKLLVDTNVMIDYLNRREPFYEDARRLMLFGYVGEFELWMSSSQITDLIYILSDGGKESRMKGVLERLRGVRAFVNVHAASGDEIDQMLASSWKDPEDALLFEIALKLKADAIITRDNDGFESDLVRVMNCAEFFDWAETELGYAYDEVPF